MTTNRNQSVWPTVVLLAVAATLAGTAQAATTGQLSGFVVDNDGAPLPGVSISASSATQIGGVLITTTDAQGWFQYPRLNPGYFTVRLELEGFLTQELTEVQVRLDRMTQVQVTMPLGTFEEEMTVTETTPVVDPQQVSIGQTFTSDFIQEAAVGMNVRWAYSQIALQAAGTSPAWRGEGESGGGGVDISVLGSTNSENVYLVDGLDTSHPYWGGVQTMFPLDSIQEISLESGGFEAEYGRATGGVINALTKSGSNALSGTFDVRYTDNNLETSGEHHDPGEQTSKFGIASATLGGRLVRDRAWFFATLEGQKYQSTPTGAPTTYETRYYRGFAKVTGQATPSWLALGKYYRNPGERLNVWSDPTTAPEATWRDDETQTILQAEASGVLSESLLWEVQVGSHMVEKDVGPMSGDSAPISHFNLATGMSTDNFFSMYYQDTRRDQLGTYLTWFVDDALGSHQVKFGAEYFRTSLDQQSCYTGLSGGGFCRVGEQGFEFLDLADETGNDIPYVMTANLAPGPYEIVGTLPSLFAQDTWQLRPNLSLKVGLRWDRSTFDNDLGEEVANLEMFQPRVGVTWDPTRNGRNILRASWGRFMNSSFLRLPRLATTTADVFEDWLSCTTFFGLSDPAACEAMASIDGLAWRTDPEGWDPGGWILDTTWGSDPTRIAPDLAPTYSDTIIVGYERELFRRTSLELSFVDKATRDIFEDTCIGNYPTPTPDADCSGFIVMNIAAASRDYRAWILNFESRALDRLHVLASYTNSDSKGSINQGRVAAGDFDVYPYHFENRYGYLPIHRKHRVKTSGYVFLPLDFGVAWNCVWGSPFRWTPQQQGRLVDPGLGGSIFVEPRGSREGDRWTQLDLQGSKGFRFGRVRLRLIASILNVFDSENATDVCPWVSGCGGGVELGDASLWQLPRRYELGVRFEF